MHRTNVSKKTSSNPPAVTFFVTKEIKEFLEHEASFNGFRSVRKAALHYLNLGINSKKNIRPIIEN